MQREDLSARDGATQGWALAPFTRRDLVKSILVTGGAVVFAGYGRVERAAAQDKVRISQWYHQYGEEGTQQAAQRYAEEYTKEVPNVEVEMVWVPGDFEGDKLPAALLTDSGPDVYEDHPSVAMVKAGQCEPLDDLLTEETKADFNPANLAVNTINGKLYGIKMIDDMGLLYTRRAHSPTRESIRQRRWTSSLPRRKNSIRAGSKGCSSATTVASPR